MNFLSLMMMVNGDVKDAVDEDDDDGHGDDDDDGYLSIVL